MSYYSDEVQRIRREYFPPQEQIDRVIVARKEARLATEGLSVAGLARVSAFSLYHFIRLFKRCYGHTPHQFITEIKLEYARSLLAKGHSVTDACYLCGYESVPSFCTTFKKYSGITPKAYKKQFSINIPA